jgi:hypothetical protein
MCAAGVSLGELAHLFSVRPATISEWQREQPDLALAILAGYAERNSRIADALLACALDPGVSQAVVQQLQHQVAARATKQWPGHQAPVESTERDNAPSPA